MSKRAVNAGESFELNEVWSSPRGGFWRVVGFDAVPGKGRRAVLRQGIDGDGRAVRRPWDAVVGWVLEVHASGLTPRDDLPMLRPGTKVWFMKSMRLCRIVAYDRGLYTLEILDSGKTLSATGAGICEPADVQSLRNGRRGAVPPTVAQTSQEERA